MKHFFPAGSQQQVDMCYCVETMEALGVLFTDNQMAELRKLCNEHRLKIKPRNREKYPAFLV